MHDVRNYSLCISCIIYRQDDHELFEFFGTFLFLLAVPLQYGLNMPQVNARFAGKINKYHAKCTLPHKCHKIMPGGCACCVYGPAMASWGAVALAGNLRPVLAECMHAACTQSGADYFLCL